MSGTDWSLRRAPTRVPFLPFSGQKKMAHTPTMKATADTDCELVCSPDVYATTMLVWALDRVGPDLLKEDWDPMTVRMECNDHLGKPLPNHSFDRLMAALTILTTDSFQTSVPDFVELCNVLSGTAFDPTRFDPADPEECAWGVTEASLIDPPEDGEAFLSPDVMAYIGHTLAEYGFMTPPKALADADQYLKDKRDQTAANTADDPTAFQAVWEKRHEKAEHVDRVVQMNASRLIDQLSRLRLKNGNNRDLVIRLEKELGGRS